jgi:hypothetical protein
VVKKVLLRAIAFRVFAAGPDHSQNRKKCSLFRPFTQAMQILVFLHIPERFRLFGRGVVAFFVGRIA